MPWIGASKVPTNVCLWLKADIRRALTQGPVTARKQTLANRVSEPAPLMSGYRSEADVGDDVAQCLLVTLTCESLPETKSPQIRRHNI